MLERKARKKEDSGLNEKLSIEKSKKEKKKEYDRMYYLQNKEKKNQHNRNYYCQNIERKKEYDKKYYLLNKEKKQEYDFRYRSQNKEKRKVFTLISISEREAFLFSHLIGI